MIRRNLGRIALLTLLVGVIVGWYTLGLADYFRFASLNANKAWLQEQVSARPVMSVAVFLLIYVTVTATSIPNATVMTVPAGALFGRGLGTLWTDLAATAGAMLSCLAARYLLRDWLRARLPAERLAAMERGIARDGMSYLLAVRLMPIFPFFLVNLAGGLSGMPLRTFALGTMVGILPGTFVYVNAGRALTDIREPMDVFSPVTLGAFALLGLFSLVPVVYKRWKQRQALRAAE
ncbi:MAG TPA: TVP38/TMEM64 family protein [bacterium]